jgi:hypothetical protein
MQIDYIVHQIGNLRLVADQILPFLVYEEYSRGGIGPGFSIDLPTAKAKTFFCQKVAAHGILKEVG